MHRCVIGLVFLGACGGKIETNETHSQAHTGSQTTTPADSVHSRVMAFKAKLTEQLTTREKQVFESLIQDLPTPCEGSTSLEQATQCDRTPTGLSYVARLLRQGYERTEIESQYQLRFSPETKVRVSKNTSPCRGETCRGVPQSEPNKIELIVFSDFECPYCGEAFPILKAVEEQFKGKIRIYFKQFPIERLHPHALSAALATVAAGKQDRFWEMHDALFEHQDELEDVDLLRHAAQIGLDVERFKSDMADEATEAFVRKDKAEGEAIGIEGTPSLIINQRVFREDMSSLPFYIQEELFAVE